MKSSNNITKRYYYFSVIEFSICPVARRTALLLRRRGGPARTLAYLQYRLADGARHRIAAKRVEVKGRLQGPGDRGCRHDGGHREPVSHALGHRHDVRRDAVRLKAPKVFTGPPEARLHFVRHAQAAVAPDQLVGFFQITLGQLNDTAEALRRTHARPVLGWTDRQIHVGLPPVIIGCGGCALRNTFRLFATPRRRIPE